ncbi:AAA family ATPase [Olivibacter jilunii]|uniref:AAA family ATPase n=1 Tax=Olivibacter jilunii TaxID=985016 RepID=UPI003F15B037
MKILAIRIQNLASLEGTTEIDFTQEPLCSAGIFAITGPTGAGKSTILDALCLALYAKTPRYLQAKESGIEVQDVQGSAINQSDARGILRDGTAEGFAEVDFVGVDGEHYRANWSVRRARNKAEGALQAYNVSLKNISNDSDIPGRKNELLIEIERLVGLNFEQFTRSILLAQGDFTAFLKAGKDEKSSLLEKLTGTHIYSEISKKIFEKHRDALQQLRELNLKREGVVTLTTEELADLEAKAAEYRLTIKAKETELEAIGKEIDWYKQLSQLQENFKLANEQYTLSYEAKEAASTRIKKLQQAEQVQPARTWIDSLVNVHGQLDTRKKDLAQININLSTVQQQQERQKDLLEEADAHLENQRNSRDRAQPILDEAKALDIQISERTRQLKAAEEDVLQAKEKQQEEAVALEQQKQEANKFKDAIGQFEQWKIQHSAKQPIADNYQLIVSKLADATQWLEAERAASNQLAIYRQEIQQAEQEQAKLFKRQGELENKHEQQQQAYQAMQSELATISLSELEQNKVVVDAQTQTLVEAKAHWQLLIQAENDFKTIQIALQQQEKELTDTNTELVATAKDVLTGKIQCETSLKMLNKVRLAASENVEVLRSQLVVGEACPVCGSTEHPYADQQPQLQHVLNELEEDHQQIVQSYEAVRNKEARLAEALDRLKKAVEVQKAAYKGKEEQLENLRHIWQSFSIYETSKAVADEQKADWLQEELTKHREKQSQLQGSIGNYYQQKAVLAQQKETLEQLEKDINLLANQEKDVERKLQSLAERLDQQRNEAEKSKVLLEGVEQRLSNYFQNEAWFANWKHNPDDFLEHINKFAAQWKSKTKELEESTNAYHLLSATIKGKEDIVQRLVGELRKKSQLFQDQRALLDQLNQQRNGFFEGKAITVVEAELKQAVDLAQRQLDQHRAEAEKLQQAFTKLHTQQEQSLKDITALEQQSDTLIKQIEDWLAEYNSRNNTVLNQQDLQDLLALGLDWLEAERKAIRQLDDAVMQARSVLAEREITLEKHQQQKLSDRDLETLTELFNTIRNNLQENQRAMNEISFRLKQDEANKKQIGELMQVIERKAAVVENWAKLNEIIGSADGKKFRQIAQEYTLDVLLSYANIHLEMLSKRYLLQRIPNTLGLQVLDQDMGDEVRTVYSLSGGESFLVSLALALGLASLSSSRMKVESLFIDEGFGSLDPNTLNIAMDALERLHNQGRKVGVISHVQEMTERIAVQIKVNKKSSGRSGVEVIGY